MKDNKTERMREAIIKFRDSDQEVSDYLYLFMVVSGVTRQEDGLLWSSVTEILAKEIGYTHISNDCEICGKEGGH